MLRSNICHRQVCICPPLTSLLSSQLVASYLTTQPRHIGQSGQASMFVFIAHSYAHQPTLPHSQTVDTSAVNTCIVPFNDISQASRYVLITRSLASLS